MTASTSRQAWSDGDIAKLVGTKPDPLRVAVVPTWFRHEGAVAAASLANSNGGLVLVGAALDDTGVLVLEGSEATDLVSVAQDLGPVGRHLVDARAVDIQGKRLGVLEVAQCGSPPVVTEHDGGIYYRTEAGLAQVYTRAELDRLVAKDRMLRQRAETNIEGMVGRIAFGHFNYMTVAVVLVPRFGGPQPYAWAQENPAELLGRAFAKRWNLGPEVISVAPGEIEIAQPTDVTGFMRIARNGCIAVGEHLKRPPQDRYLSTAELASLMEEFVDMACLPYEATRPGLVLPSLFLEGIRDLRLEVDDGLSAPPAKDVVQAFVAERHVDDEEERSALVADVRQAAGNVFAVDILSGARPVDAAPARSRATAVAWRGQTKRTERRLSGARDHGSV